MTRTSLRLVAVIALLLVSCGDLFDPAAGVVRDRKITIDEVTRRLEGIDDTEQFRELARQQGRDRLERQYQQAILSQLIRREVFRPLAAERGIEVSDAEVERMLEEIKAEFPSEEEFTNELQAQGLTLAQLREIVRDNEIERRVREEVTEDVSVSEEEIRAHYEANIHSYSETRAAHILLDDERTAQAVSRQLAGVPRGRIDEVFRRLAREHSKDAGSARRGGDLGFSAPGTFVEPFEAALAELEVGEISQPVRTEFGFHIIRILDRRIESFDEARAEIEDELLTEAQEEAWQDFVVRAYEEADVKVNPRFGELDLETQQIVDPERGDIPGTAPASPTPTPTAGMIAPEG